MGAWVEFFNLRLNSGKGGGCGDAMEDDLVPDFVFSEANGCRDGGSSCFLNGRTMRFEDRGGRCVILGEEEDMVVGGEFDSCNKRFLDCIVDCIANGEGVGGIR